MANIATGAVQSCLLSPGIGLAINQASISLCFGKAEQSPVWQSWNELDLEPQMLLPSLWPLLLSLLGLLISKSVYSETRASPSVCWLFFGWSVSNAGFVLWPLVHGLQTMTLAQNHQKGG